MSRNEANVEGILDIVQSVLEKTYVYKAQHSEEQCWRKVGGDADLGSITQF